MKSDQALTPVARMQQIADRLIAATPDLAKVLQPHSVLRRETAGLASSYTKKEFSERQTSKRRLDGTQKLLISTKSETAAECFDRNSQLVSAVVLLKDKVGDLEKQLQTSKKIHAKRQLQFKDHIQELHIELQTKSILDGEDRSKMDKIVGLHSQIIDNINSIQKNTSRILIQQESQIIHFFNKKIHQIKDKFRRQRIDKGEKDQQYIQKQKQLVGELQWIKNIAQKIDSQNHNLMKKYLDLKAQFQILQNDRQNLFKELVLKKKRNAILKVKNEQYQKVLKQLQDQPAKKQQSRQLSFQVESSHSYPPSQIKPVDNIKQIKKALQNQKIQVRQIKQAYIKQLEKRSQLQKVLRECINDLKEQILQKQAEKRIHKRNDDEKQLRQKQIEFLLQQEKALNLIYDQTFFVSRKRAQLDISGI